MVQAIIDALQIRSYATLSLGDGTCAVERVLASAAIIADAVTLLIPPGSLETDPSNSDTYLCVDGGRVHLPDTVHVFEVADTGAKELLPVLSEIGAGSEAVVYKRADEPWMLVDEAQRLIDEHTRFRAHYTFADGYPSGATPVVLSPSLPRLLSVLATDDDDTAKHDWIFTILQRDINSFDVETLLSPVDFRMLRITFRCETRADYVLCSRFQPLLCDAETGEILPKERYVEAVSANYSRLRTLPMFMAVQITDASPQKILYSPYAQEPSQQNGVNTHMAPERFRELVGKLSAFSPEAVVGIGPHGEPLQHPDLEAVIDTVCRTESLSLLIETSGVGLSADEVVTLARRYGNRVTWIIALDAIDEQVYRRIRGEGYDAARACAEALIESSPDTSYVQAVRMKETEEHLETFWRYWKEKTDHIIVQKYDDYCGVLPPRKVTDLSPVRRFPCWHNKRDLHVFLDGTVPRCREDIHARYSLGNLFLEAIDDIWTRGESLHLEHVQGRYPDICEHCDEYYTFNF